MNECWEIHFCEGSYFMAKREGTESGIIGNTMTELVGKIYTREENIQDILIICNNAYNINKIYPIED